MRPAPTFGKAAKTATQNMAALAALASVRLDEAIGAVRNPGTIAGVALGVSAMPDVEEVMKLVRAMTPDEFDDLREQIDALDEAQYRRDRVEATRAFQAAGLTDDDVDQAVSRVRREGRTC